MSYMLRAVGLLAPVLLSTSAALAQNDAETRELRNYRLTMAVMRQIDAATEAMVAEMQKDPRYGEFMKLEAEISALEKKGEPTEAENKLAADIAALENKETWTDAEVARLERLREQLEERQQKREMRTDAENARLEQLRAKRDAREDAEGRQFQEAETLSDMEAAIRQQPAMARALRSAGMAPREYAKFMVTMIGAGAVAALKKAGTITEIPKDLADQVSAENVKFLEEHEAELTALFKKWEGMGKRTR